MDRLKGKIAVVTGFGSGIGKGTAIMFAKEGAKVIGVDFNEEAGEATKKAIIDAGGEAVFIKTNVRNKDEIKSMAKAAVEAFGKVDILVNAAGVLVHKPFLDHNDEDYKFIEEVNFRGYYWIMQEFLPVMSAQHSGSIINVASISALKPESDAYIYGAFKAAIYNMTRNLCREFSPKGVRLNVICPGPVNTNMTPDEIKNSKEAQEAVVKAVCLVGRLGEPEDIAYLAVYLASDESSWVTGAAFVCDGGACMAG